MRLIDISQIEAFLQGSKKLVIELSTIEEKYQFIRETLKRLNYPKQNRKGRKLIYLYLKKFTGYKKAQLYDLIAKSLEGKLQRVVYHRSNTYVMFHRTDIKLLEQTDELHLKLNRYATAEILHREVVLFNHHEYDTIAQASPSHLDNLRKSQSYISYWVNGTKSKSVAIGTTQVPEHNHKPGSIRIDSVHQRDVYHINSVDEITQWEIVICVPQISEQYLNRL